MAIAVRKAQTTGEGPSPWPQPRQHQPLTPRHKGDRVA